jgi:glutathione S-transferase
MRPQIVLYGNTPITSPYVMSVFVALEEKRLPFELELLDLTEGEQHDPDFVRRSITGRVPTLFIADPIAEGAAVRPGTEPRGVWLSESVAITEYLEERFPPPQHARLYPADLQERARVRMLQGLIRSDFMALREERSTETIFQGAPSRPLSETAEAARVRLIRVATALVGEGQASIASEFSIADLDLATMLQRLVHNRDPISEILVDYARSIWKRPSVEKWLALTQYPG